MALTPSTMLPLGTNAPDFKLPDTKGNNVSLSDFNDSKALVVVFMCNHCPFVKHVRDGLVRLAKDYRDKGVGMVGISANDVANYPEDGPEKMAEEAEKYGYPFPYLYDETQEVAKAYRAACTPDFYLFDGNHELVYRGQMDPSRPDNGVPVTGKDIREAIDAVLERKAVPEDQIPSVGCNIKWKQGNEPDYYG